MRYELKSIGIWSVIKVSFFLNGILGFIYGLLNALFIGFLLSVSSVFPIPEMWIDPADFSWGFLFVVFPIVMAIGFAVFLTILCALTAVLYNVVARLVGGYELDLTSAENSVGVQAASRPIPAQASAAAFSPPPPPPVRQTPPTPPPSEPQPGGSDDEHGERPLS